MKIGKVLGKGAYGSVHKIVGENKVIKLLDVDIITLEGGDLRKTVKRVRREVAILKRLRNHKHVVKYYCVKTLSYQKKKYIGIVMEYIQGVELRELYPHRIPLNVMKSITRQLALAMQSIHDLDIVHRDIKMNNIMLTKNGVLKLVDFGFSCYTSNKKPQCEKRVMGTFDYMAPELFTGDYSVEGLKSIDMWAVGVTLYSLANRKKPFSAGDRSSLMSKIIEGRRKKSKYGNKKIDEIVEACLMDHYDRLTAEEMVLMSKKL